MSFYINFETNGNKECTTAIVRVDTDLSCKLNNILFEFECGRAYIAQLLVKHCQEQFEESIQEFAKRCYELGWKDKSAKHRKRTSFTTSLNDSIPAW